MKKHLQPLTLAALYARVSSERQDVDLSVSAQLRALKDYAKSNGYSVAREYVDEALHLVSQRRCVVRTDHLRHATQFPESVLETLLQGQEGLPGNHLGVPPSRVAQHQLE